MTRYYDFKLKDNYSVTYRVNSDFSVTRAYFKGEKCINKFNTKGRYIIKSDEEALHYILCSIETILSTENR
jgi:hypothetical protein